MGNKEILKTNRIKLEGLMNTRDLGGIKTADGHEIIPGALIRSGQLDKGTENDLKTVFGGYGVKTVIDLRMDIEVEKAPDPIPEGVGYYRLPLLDSSFLGIARDDYSIDAWLNMFSSGSGEPEKVFADMYCKMVFSDYTRPYLKRFFEIIRDSEEGAVLWHCSAGKDRVGVTTALLLSLLGCSRDTVIDDYLATGFFTLPEIIKVRVAGPFHLKNFRVNRALSVLMGVRKMNLTSFFDKIDSDYGSVEGYLTERIGLTKDDISKIRENYLTK